MKAESIADYRSLFCLFLSDQLRQVLLYLLTFVICSIYRLCGPCLVISVGVCFIHCQVLKLVWYSSILFGICVFLIHFEWDSYIMYPVFVQLISGDVR